VSFQRLVRSVLKSIPLIALAATLFAGFQTPSAHGQDTLDRKVKSKVSPLYPEIARKMNLGGVVKLQVIVAPNGVVKETKVIGGNPILVNAALDAVKKWRFEPASEESAGVLEFKFDPTIN
jgi:TonB family protein